MLLSKLLPAVVVLGLTSAMMAQNVPSYVPTDGLVGWWPFSGNANDESGNGNNGTVSGAILVKDRYGNNNSAYSFDGINNIITIPHSSSLTFTGSEVTISFWVKLTSYQNNGKWNNNIYKASYPGLSPYGLRTGFVNQGGGSNMAFYIANGSYSTARIVGADYKTNIGLNNCNWKHVVFTNDNDNLKLYIDGILISQSANNGTIIGVSNDPLYFGGPNQPNPNTDDYFAGLMDDIGIWNRALTQQEITNFFNSVPTAQDIEIVISAENPSCYGDNTGNIFVDVTGGTFPFTYDWNNNVYDNLEDLFNVKPGYYFLTVTDANSCSAEAGIEVVEPDSIVVAASISPITCNGNSDGAIDLTIEGGFSPYFYNWNNDTNDGAEDLSNLSAGTYSVTVTDSLQCATAISVTLDSPEMLEAALEPFPVSCHGGSDGSVDLEVTGGVGGYTFAWSDNNLNDQEDPSGISAGTYYVTISDSNGCTLVTGTTINEPTPLTLGTSFAQATCGNANGSISLDVTGGTLPYYFDWDDDTLDGQEDPISLLAGDYTVTVIDGNNCTISATVSMPNPPDLEAIISAEDALCFSEASGSISVTVTGGELPYEFDWNENTLDGQEDPIGLAAGNYSLTITDNNGCTLTAFTDINEPDLLVASGISQATECAGGSDGSIDLTVIGGTEPYVYQWDSGVGGLEDPVGLLAGTYQVTVTDQQGCTATTSVTVSEPTILSLDLMENAVKCNGGSDGSIDLTVTGGILPYSFQWSNNAGMVEDPSGLVAGVYQVTVTDGNGCTDILSATITEPAPISTNIQLSEYGDYNVSCADSVDGFAEVQVLGGGSFPFTFSWSNGFLGVRAENLGAGTYTVTITDSVGCTEAEEVNITAPQNIVTSLVAESVTCYGDSDGIIYVEDPAGGIPPYRYGISGILATNSTPVFDQLAPGTYTITVFDAQGCQWKDEISVLEPSELTVDLGEDIFLILGDSVELVAKVDDPFNVATVRWTGLIAEGCPDCLQQVVRPFETTNYSTTIVDSSGCVASDEIRVRVDRQRPIYIPTAFSPNGDGYNDMFYIGGGLNVIGIDELIIFDRWGEQLFFKRDINPNDALEGWDGRFEGRLMDSGVYVYYVKVTFVDGKQLVYKGGVTLVK